MKTNENQVPSWNNFWKGTNIGPNSKISWSKKRIINLFSPQVIPENWVLDAGCGSGFFSNFFAESGMRVVALDNSEVALQACKKLCKNDIECLNEDLLDQNLGKNLKNKFDLIFSDGLLEHFNLRNQRTILKNFSEMLKPGGRIVTLVPNKFSPWQLIRPFMMPGIIEFPMTLKQLVRLNRLCHLKILSEGGLNVLPISFSPEKLLGRSLGMLLYTVSTKEVSNC